MLWICGTLTITFLQTEHFSSHQRSSLSSYPANELHPNYPQDLSSTAACQVISQSVIASLLTGSIVKHCVVDSLITFFRSIQPHAPFQLSWFRLPCSWRNAAHWGQYGTNH